LAEEGTELIELEPLFSDDWGDRLYSLVLVKLVTDDDDDDDDDADAATEALTVELISTCDIPVDVDIPLEVLLL